MRPIHVVILAGLCLLLAGCSASPPAKFYILTPVGDGTGAATGVSGPALGIGPVRFPAYLERPEIVRRLGDNQLHFAGSQRWAEPLKTAFSRTLAENLAIMLPTDRVSLYPWARSAGIEYQISIDVLRFDADASGTVVLEAGWEVSRASDETVMSHHKTAYTEAADGRLAYPAIVAAQSRAIERLSRDIAAAIRDNLQPARQPGT